MLEAIEFIVLDTKGIVNIHGGHFYSLAVNLCVMFHITSFCVRVMVMLSTSYELRLLGHCSTMWLSLLWISKEIKFVFLAKKEEKGFKVFF